MHARLLGILTRAGGFTVHQFPQYTHIVGGGVVDVFLFGTGGGCVVVDKSTGGGRRKDEVPSAPSSPAPVVLVYPSVDMACDNLERGDRRRLRGGGGGGGGGVGVEGVPDVVRASSTRRGTIKHLSQ